MFSFIELSCPASIVVVRVPIEIGKMISNIAPGILGSGSYILAGNRQTTARQQCRIPDEADDGQKSWNPLRLIEHMTKQQAARAQHDHGFQKTLHELQLLNFLSFESMNPRKFLLKCNFRSA